MGNKAQAQLSAAVKPGNKVNIQMGTPVTTTATAYYELQRSDDNQSFKTIAIIFPAEASQTMPAAYNDDVKAVKASRVYYRLKLIDGTRETFTESVPITLGAAAESVSR
jgi:hypothetical protein